jgi:prepilin-type N-terminal cleavage/methylation domain-containing protein
MKKADKHGFTVVEVMLVVSIIGLLATLGIPAILRAYTNAQNTAMDNNVTSVEKAKGVLTLPRGLGMAGAMELTADREFDAEVVSNLCAAMRISDQSELNVGNHTISIGTLTLRAYYD